MNYERGRWIVMETPNKDGRVDVRVSNGVMLGGALIAVAESRELAQHIVELHNAQADALATDRNRLR